MDPEQEENAKLWAANQLEELLIVGKEFVNLLRKPETSNKLGYALLYHLRGEMSKLTRVLGFDLPVKRELRIAKSIAEQQINTKD